MKWNQNMISAVPFLALQSISIIVKLHWIKRIITPWIAAIHRRANETTDCVGCWNKFKILLAEWKSNVNNDFLRKDYELICLAFHQIITSWQCTKQTYAYHDKLIGVVKHACLKIASVSTVFWRNIHQLHLHL